MGIAISVQKRVRAPIVADLFYPDDAAELQERLRSYGLGSGAGPAGPRAAAIIAPHGAWDISGAIAGAAFAAAAGRRISHVALLGTIHNYTGNGLFLSESDCFETPLGDLSVDLELCEELASCGTMFEINDIPHLREHSLEVLLPFIKFCFPDVEIVPVLTSVSRPPLISSLARGLKLVFDDLKDETLFVVSANLSVNTHETAARTQAEECVRLLQENRTEQFIAGLYDGRISACGGPLIAALLESGLIEGAVARLVSGPLKKNRGEKDNTVFYGGISFTYP
ncbi:hypothetical protein FACS1894141_2780 [Spirochaetia bacterium]|nr:hypothetical protein FACS1894141_2780 [Spirochaetia bacterium]